MEHCTGINKMLLTRSLLVMMLASLLYVAASLFKLASYHAGMTSADTNADNLQSKHTNSHIFHTVLSLLTRLDCMKELVTSLFTRYCVRLGDFASADGFRPKGCTMPDMDHTCMYMYSVLSCRGSVQRCRQRLLPFAAGSHSS